MQVRTQTTLRLFLYDLLPGKAGRRFLGSVDLPDATHEVRREREREGERERERERERESVCV